MLQLVPLAESVVKLNAVCMHCFKDAAFTKRLGEETKVLSIDINKLALVSITWNKEIILLLSMDGMVIYHMLHPTVAVGQLLVMNVHYPFHPIPCWRLCVLCLIQKQTSMTPEIKPRPCYFKSSHECADILSYHVSQNYGQVANGSTCQRQHQLTNI